MMNKLRNLMIGVAWLVLALVVIVPYLKTDEVQGSVATGQEYNSTTTRDTNIRGELLLKTGSGTLGSVLVLNQLGTQEVFALYDATTSNINLRTGNTPTSSILLAGFYGTGNNSFKGTAQFDTVFNTGLLWANEGNGSDIATTTITWR